jgi:uncharacterized membrane protein
MVAGIIHYTLDLFSMNKYNPIYYLLIVLLIMGGFASMAQNDYGMKILGLVALAFSILFGVQLISLFMKKESRDNSDAVELVCLMVLSAILAMRVFYLRFPLVEIVFGVAGLLMVLLYARKLFRTYRENQPKNKLMAWLIVLFHASIILYVVSMGWRLRAIFIRP